MLILEKYKSSFHNYATNEMNRLPPPPPPPPLPPRPPRPQGSPSIHSNQSQQQQQLRRENNSSNESLGLGLQEQHEQKQSKITIRSAAVPEDLVQLLITPAMTHNDLAHCIAHAALSPPQTSKLLETWSMEEGEANWTRIAGLFRESDGVFIPISLILYSPQLYVNDVFRVSRHLHGHQPSSSFSSRKPSMSTSIFTMTALIVMTIGGLLSSVIMTMDFDYFNFGLETFYEHVDIVTTSVLNFPTFLIETTINYPLKELYRHGPSMIGWEGSTLPNICAQITHMGDETFWARNIDECEKIYGNKEMAMLHVRKPIVYIIIAVTAFYAIQALLKTWAIQKQYRPPKEMIETYEAYRLVMKVLRRGITPNRNSASH